MQKQTNPLLNHLGITYEDLDDTKFDPSFKEIQLLEKTIEFLKLNIEAVSKPFS